MKKLNKVNGGKKDTIEAFACYCGCDCTCGANTGAYESNIISPRSTLSSKNNSGSYSLQWNNTKYA
jgi:putative bacteriocin precursor, CLI_3235 family